MERLLHLTFTQTFVNDYVPSASLIIYDVSQTSVSRPDFVLGYSKPVHLETSQHIKSILCIYIQSGTVLYLDVSATGSLACQGWLVQGGWIIANCAGL